MICKWFVEECGGMKAGYYVALVGILSRNEINVCKIRFPCFRDPLKHQPWKFLESSLVLTLQWSINMGGGGD